MLDVDQVLAPGEEAGQRVEGDRGQLGPEPPVDLVADVGRPGRVQLAGRPPEQLVDLGVGEPAVVAGAVGPVGVLAAGDDERVAGP